VTPAVALALAVNAVALSALVVFAARVRADVSTRAATTAAWSLTFFAGCLLLSASVIATLRALLDLIGA
jgi:hypothetical protein